MENNPISEFNAALARAQAKYKKAEKNGRGQVRQGKATEFSTYEDLKDATTAALTSEGLSVNHAIKKIDGILWNVTYLKHSSGHFEDSYWPLPNIDDDQRAGGTMTYSSRYCYRGLTGVACDDDDDDGEAQSKSIQGNKKDWPHKQDLIPKKDAPTKYNVPAHEILKVDELPKKAPLQYITPEQLQILESQLKGNPAIAQEMIEKLEIKSFKEIDRDSFMDIMANIQRIKEARRAQ